MEGNNSYECTAHNSLVNGDIKKTTRIIYFNVPGRGKIIIIVIIEFINTGQFYQY